MNLSDSVGEGRGQSNAPIVFCEVGLARLLQSLFKHTLRQHALSDFGVGACESR